jgi:hypothetical protein
MRPDGRGAGSVDDGAGWGAPLHAAMICSGEPGTSALKPGPVTTLRPTTPRIPRTLHASRGA